MNEPSWLDDLPVLGRMPIGQMTAKLREVGEEDLADSIEADRYDASAETYGLPSSWQRADRAFRHTGHAIGYLPPTRSPRVAPITIHHAGNIAPDPSLAGKHVVLTLDALHVADYPGHGPHRILFEFAAGEVHFNSAYRAAEGEHAAVRGRPIFIGLPVGEDGLLLQVATINVHNEDDEAFLGFLDSTAFTAGLQLATSWQPALVPLSAMVVALTKQIASRHRNVPVQTIEVGLDFRAGPVGARLAEGAYIIAQIPESAQTVWRWRHWVYDPASGHVISATDHDRRFPYNFFTIGISRCKEPPGK